ncbi:steroid Delta-isomerase [Methylomarinovum caldicuralii]|uniref:Steroid Delta-isomerase n=1 Tax=Methylomarinovum caldicuralii TaxID=438856 RepID=A0AAU9CSR9_9GAMM|nr:nuclear transport factor 2 family protein [Methylomarinovum caldicuralii]BCX80962.1 steroid Delta-isomerase [Methylomarinovum caldicuralii]
MTLTPETATAFAHDWIAAWNARDLVRILGHYAEDVHVTSPIAARLTGRADVHGKPALAAYFREGLARYPNLHFRLEHVFLGDASLVLGYANQDGAHAAEFMRLDERGQVVRMIAHYAAA